MGLGVWVLRIFWLRDGRFAQYVTLVSLKYDKG